MIRKWIKGFVSEYRRGCEVKETVAEDNVQDSDETIVQKCREKGTVETTIPIDDSDSDSLSESQEKRHRVLVWDDD